MIVVVIVNFVASSWRCAMMPLRTAQHTDQPDSFEKKNLYTYHIYYLLQARETLRFYFSKHPVYKIPMLATLILHTHMDISKE